MRSRRGTFLINASIFPIIAIIFGMWGGRPFANNMQIQSKCQVTYTTPGPKHLLVKPDTGDIAEDARPDGLYSPDGRKVVIMAQDGGKLVLQLTDVAGTTPPITLNPSGTDAIHPAWSPDSKQIAFTAYQGIVYNIYLADADGSNIHNLTNSQAQDDFAAWSPDSKRIVFRSNRALPNLMWMINADGSGLQSYQAGGGPYAWSPDGKYVAAQTPPNRIDVVAVDSTTVNTITGGNIRRFAPMWSPDSHWVGYIEGGIIEGPPPGNRGVTQGRGSGVIKMHPDGSGRVQITPNNLSVSEAQWAPDADIVAFIANNQVYLVNGDGTNLRPVAGASDANYLGWSCS